MEENSNGTNKATGIIIVILVVIVILGGAWYWFSYKPEQEAKEKARQEQLAKAAAKKKREEAAALKKTKYDQLITNADKEFEQEYWETAKSSYAEASSLFPKEQYPKDQLVLVNQKLDEIAVQTNSAGTVETLSSATGRFYVVVSSSIDGDLAMDYGNKMAEEGNSVKIIEPYGSIKFYRVSLGDYDNWDNAIAASTSFSSIDGDAVWVLEY
ncbi:hypothetical protein [Reichenbachiella faecimaris]|nr:hypothetical protein [Reichenbachiella faecimaris]